MEAKQLKQEILAGKIFIYPTDTIYGLGCDATNEKAVKKIREIKKRDSKSFSVIAPSIKWIYDNCEVDVELESYLPGPYTILLKKKNPEFLTWVSNNDKLGVRIPDNKFTQELQKAEVPFITTSVNLSGEPFALTLEDIKPEISKQVDHVIAATETLSGKPSTLVIAGNEEER